jgi:dipeptidyl aminopeptidase/acylaminoacyl peptidase
MNTSAKFALAAAVVGVAVVGILLLRVSGELGQSSPPSTQAPVPSPATRTTASAVAPPSSTASPEATLSVEGTGGSPPVVGPAGNGLIAYSSDGDIFVGDPMSGTSTAIVTGPSNDTRPIFSPDGLRIAFVRAESLSDMSIVVVRGDGSDERIVVAEDFGRWIGPFAWSPDSTSILVNHDSHTRATGYFDGELSLFEASGVAEPRLLTPPLPAKIGYTYFSSLAEVAPMLRPPKGDRVLADRVEGPEVLSVLDIDGNNVEEFALAAMAELAPYNFGRPAWSPDGSMIGFPLTPEAAREASEVFIVMNADGSDLRRYPSPSDDWAWSPDGSNIALQRHVTAAGRDFCDADIAGHACQSVIAILDLETGAERVLEATYADLKDMASITTDPDAFRTYSIRTHHAYAYEGWSWTPDGRSIVVLERHGTRPLFVDIETGQVTELPWEVDGAISWQRVPIK